MSDNENVEQWVCLLRVGTFEMGGQSIKVTRETIDSMVLNFAIRPGPIPVWSSVAALGPPIGMPQPFSGATITKLEVREDERGAYLAALLQTPPVSAAFIVDAIDRTTGQRIGPRLTDAYFAFDKLQPNI